MDNSQPEISARVVIIGKMKVGKTSLVKKFLRDSFSENTEPTVGVLAYPFVINEFNQKIVVSFCDTAGQEKYRSLGALYYRDSVAAIIVFDLTDLESFEQIGSWIREYKSYCPTGMIFFAGNKSDLRDDIVVSSTETDELASKHSTDCIWTSSFDGTGVKELFNLVTEFIKQSAIDKINAEETQIRSLQKKDEVDNRSCC